MRVTPGKTYANADDSIWRRIVAIDGEVKLKTIKHPDRGWVGAITSWSLQEVEHWAMREVSLVECWRYAPA